MTFKFEFLELMKKLNKLNWSSIGIRKNYNNGQLQENKNKRTMLFCKSIEKKMTLK